MMICESRCHPLAFQIDDQILVFLPGLDTNSSQTEGSNDNGVIASQCLSDVSAAATTASDRTDIMVEVEIVSIVEMIVLLCQIIATILK